MVVIGNDGIVFEGDGLDFDCIGLMFKVLDVNCIGINVVMLVGYNVVCYWVMGDVVCVFIGDEFKVM